jgi:hypothetical protein
MRAYDDGAAADTFKAPEMISAVAETIGITRS